MTPNPSIELVCTRFPGRASVELSTCRSAGHGGRFPLALVRHANHRAP